MNLLAEWSTRRKHRAAVPGSEPARQDSLDHTALLATKITVPIGIIGTNGTGVSAETDPKTPPELPQDLVPGTKLHVSVDAMVADLKTVFMGDGPASEAAAKRVAKARGADGPAGDDLPAWQAWMNRRYTVWRMRGFSRAEALGLVWGEAEAEWHKRHGAVPAPDRCAGCGMRVLVGDGMSQIDGAIVHIGDPEQVECLAICGAQWRAAASAGLMALGLMRPQS